MLFRCCCCCNQRQLTDADAPAVAANPSTDVAVVVADVVDPELRGSIRRRSNAAGAGAISKAKKE